jgi:hypothetical protein
MKFDDGDKFPKLKNYLVFDFGQLASNNAVVNGMKKWGKMSSDQARSYIIPGSGPRIIIVDDKDDFISKSVINFPVSLNLKFSLVHAFEIKETLPQARTRASDPLASGPSSAVYMTGNGKRIYQVGLKLLELLIRGHLSKFSDELDDRDFSKVQKGLLAFEQEVYGGVTGPF